MNGVEVLQDMDDFAALVASDTPELDELLAEGVDTIDGLRQACALVDGYDLNGRADEVLQQIAETLSCPIEIVRAQYGVIKDKGTFSL